MLNKVVCIVLSVLCFWGCSHEENEQSVQSPPQSHSFSLSLVDGGDVVITKKDGDNTWDFEGLDGRLKLLFFFDIACEPCRSMLPHLVDIQNNHNNHLEIFGILTTPASTPAMLNEFLQAYNINFKVALLTDAISDAFYNDGPDIPYTVLYDFDGHYVIHYSGILPQEMLEFDIQKTLAQSGEESNIGDSLPVEVENNEEYLLDINQTDITPPSDVLEQESEKGEAK